MKSTFLNRYAANTLLVLALSLPLAACKPTAEAAAQSAPPEVASTTPTAKPNPAPSGAAPVAAAPAAAAVKPPAFDPSSITLTSAQRQKAEWALLGQVLKEQNPTQLSATAAALAFSPSSMTNALQALWWGTRGDTAIEMAKLFGAEPGAATAPPSGETSNAVPASLGGSVTLRSASSLWVDEKFPVREEYAKLLKQRGLGMAEKVNWSKSDAALARVNGWSADVTGGKIATLFEAGDIRPPVAFVLASVVSFQGSWASAFDPAQTRTEDFTLLDGSRRPASYLKATKEVRTAKVDAAGAAILELPFSDGRHRMVIALPDKPGAAPLANLEKALSAGMPVWLKALKSGSVSISLPKFNVGRACEPRAALEALGVKKIFSEKEADFTGASEILGLKLDAIRHHARVRIDENGAEAVAATAASVAAKGFATDTVEFRADHPFLFFILGEGDELLFAGRVALPEAPSGTGASTTESTPAGVATPGR